VRPVLLYDTNNLMHHAGIVRTNLDNIRGPNFNQVPLDYKPHPSYAPKNSSLAREIHIIFRRGWLLTKFQPLPVSIAPYVHLNIFVLSAIQTFNLVLCVIEKPLAYVVA
jgi:hypothetical protein